MNFRKYVLVDERSLTCQNIFHSQADEIFRLRFVTSHLLETPIIVVMVIELIEKYKKLIEPIGFISENLPTGSWTIHCMIGNELFVIKSLGML